jgi:hypothetical protein
VLTAGVGKIAGTSKIGKALAGAVDFAEVG